MERLGSDMSGAITSPMAMTTAVGAALTESVRADAAIIAMITGLSARARRTLGAFYSGAIARALISELSL
jgi:hypothetical protein